MVGELRHRSAWRGYSADGDEDDGLPSNSPFLSPLLPSNSPTSQSLSLC